MYKKLEDYLKLPYEIHIETDYDEGLNKNVYYAHINEFGKNVCYGRGYSHEEALKSLNEVKKDIISYYIKKRIPIPEPIPKIDEDLPSGKFLIRTSPNIHQQLIKQAKQTGISLNLFVNHLLTKNMQMTEINKKLDEIRDCLEEHKQESEILFNINAKSFYGRKFIKSIKLTEKPEVFFSYGKTELKTVPEYKE